MIIKRLFIGVLLIVVAVNVFGGINNNVRSLSKLVLKNVEMIKQVDEASAASDEQLLKLINVLGNNLNILYRRIEKLEQRVQYENKLVIDLQLQETLKDI